jgi:hypothetical protein
VGPAPPACDFRVSRRKKDRLGEALVALEKAFVARATPHMIIGGVAVIARGVPRLTRDIDAAVPGADNDLSDLLPAVRRQKIFPRIPDAETFARETQVLLLEHRPTAVEIDLSLCRHRCPRVPFPPESPGTWGPGRKVALAGS